jgi:hypothetical protein
MKMEHTIPIILQFDETFDVGANTGIAGRRQGLPGSVQVQQVRG